MAPRERWRERFRLPNVQGIMENLETSGGCGSSCRCLAPPAAVLSGNGFGRDPGASSPRAWRSGSERGMGANSVAVTFGKDMNMRSIILATAALLFCVGTLRAETTFVGADKDSQKITINMNGKDYTFDARGVRLYNPNGQEIKLEDFSFTRRGARLDVKEQGGKIVEIRVAGGRQ